jgi:hypothetical protein
MSRLSVRERIALLAPAVRAESLATRGDVG